VTTTRTTATSAEPLLSLPDGTVKQLNLLTGTQVWTVPGRGNRPLATAGPRSGPEDGSAGAPDDPGPERRCAFCIGRALETPPEKARLVRDGDAWRTLVGVPASELGATVPAFRRVPNLFEIQSLDYWRANHGYELPPAVRARRDAYLADPAGRAHVLAVARTKALASGLTADGWERLSDEGRLGWSSGFFGGGHDVIVAQRHLAADPHDASRRELAGSGTLSPAEHAAYVAFTVESIRDLLELNPFAVYVQAFQNWLRPAGASFDHLHKQLVAIDEHGAETERTLERLRRNRDLHAEVLAAARRHGLILAENDAAIAFAGFGHRYPSLEVWSTRPGTPMEHSAAEVEAVSDLLHAMHAATGTGIPTNEEWHLRPRDVPVTAQLPWRVLLKWRVSTLAGFEGGTKINVNTISPYGLRDRLAPRLAELRAEGRLAASVRLVQA
jgi:galactose-1-phosphate uridylyltransferase